jgi:hypothetical protein
MTRDCHIATHVSPAVNQALLLSTRWVSGLGENRTFGPYLPAMHGILISVRPIVWHCRAAAIHAAVPLQCY